MRTLRTLGIIVSAAIALSSAPTAFAESGPGSNGDGRSGNDRRPAGLVRPIMASTTASTTPRGEIGEKMRERLQSAREEMRSRLDDRQEKARQRLGDIRDKQKQQEAERLTKQFDKINTEWTDHFTKVLDQYDALLKKIQARAVLASASSTVAIDAAKAAIETARAAVLAQAAKDYTPDSALLIPTTSTTTPTGQENVMKKWRESFKKQHEGLFKDLFALRDGPMKDVRRAVQEAVQSLGKTRGERAEDNRVTSTSRENE